MTYYYDVRDVEVYGASFVEPNKGPVGACALDSLVLDHVNSNCVVAMNHSQLTLEPKSEWG